MSFAPNINRPALHPAAWRPYRTTNVGAAERVASAVLGGGLALLGVKRRSFFGLGLAGLGAALICRGATGRCEIYKGLGINTARPKSRAAAVRAQRGCRIERSIVIQRLAEDLYSFWEQLENLPQVMRHLESVEPLDALRSRWTASGPGGRRLSWDAEVIERDEPRLIAWRSLPGSEVDTADSVHFEPATGNRGTVGAGLTEVRPAGGCARREVGRTVRYRD